MKLPTMAIETLNRIDVTKSSVEELYNTLQAIEDCKLQKAEVNTGSTYVIFQFKDESKLELAVYYSWTNGSRWASSKHLRMA